MKNKIIGYTLALGAVFIWSLNYTIATYLSNDVKPLEFAFGRWAIASVIFLPFLIPDFKKNLHLLKQHFSLLFWMTITGMVLNNTLIYYASETTSAIDMSLINIAGPIFLIILSAIFLKTHISLLKFFGIIIVIFGVILVASNGELHRLKGFSGNLGTVLMLINALTFAVYSILQYYRPPELSQTAALGICSILGAFILLPFLIVSEIQNPTFFHLTKSDFAFIAFLGIFNSVLAYLFWNIALKRIGSVTCGILSYLLPVFAILSAFFFLGETVSKISLVGMGIIFGGIILLNIPNLKKEI